MELAEPHRGKVTYSPCLVGPNSISINSKTAAYTIHKSAQCFNKTEAYDLHLKGEGLFFVKERDRHAVRRRPWNRAMSNEAYVRASESAWGVDRAC